MAKSGFLGSNAEYPQQTFAKLTVKSLLVRRGYHNGYGFSQESVRSDSGTTEQKRCAEFGSVIGPEAVCIV